MEQVKGRNCKGTGTGDYMLRTVQQHHVRLSSMADSKANIVIATLAIVLSLTLNNLLSSEYRITIVSFIIFCLLSLTFALLSVSPVFSFKRRIKRQIGLNSNVFLDYCSNNVNPLFFGHFTCWDFDKYYEIINSVLEDQESVYQMLIKDLYHMGLILKKKYSFINLSYKCFFFGIIITLIIFFIEHLMM